jgi:hypothetical protein
MRAMRVSLVARFVSHPTIDFGSARRSTRRPQLGLPRSRMTYHRSRRGATASVGTLRSQTSRFRFPPVGRLLRVPARRTPSLFGLRARRG